MDLEPVSCDDHLLDRQLQDGPFDLKARVVEVAAECLRNGLDALDLAGRQFSPGGPGSEFRLFLFDREDPLLDVGFARLEVIEIQRARLVGIDQPFSLTVEFPQPVGCALQPFVEVKKTAWLDISDASSYQEGRDL